ncbi:endonuclease III domain-containing protein [Limisalsivibrio acetivorans]|uniref:endonuclease III domain-containing protein n=1 Tax=Limisalsivibrio acetivorans TaxID=1304888 RepID=UPI0003B7677C|nr:endonuclease III [Limisalsivibrio acetivorans]
MHPSIEEIYEALRSAYKDLEKPSITQISEDNEGDPYRVLISTVISLRTKDEVTVTASRKLFEHADSPESMLKLSEEDIAELIYPAGFYRNKSKSIREISQRLIEDYGGEVPDSIDELVKLKGVGRKTANLVLVEGFRIPAVCVDTHVHRIFNRLGYVSTKNPDQTETALREKLPKEYWIDVNEMMVTYGKYICKPVSPLCSSCKLEKSCAKIGVTRWR